MSHAIASVSGVCVIIDVDGNVATVDSTQGGPVVFDRLTPKPVLPISVTASGGGGMEACVVVDAVGNCWRGPIRANRQKYTLIGKLPERKSHGG